MAVQTINLWAARAAICLRKVEEADLLRAFMAHQKIPVDTDFARLFYSFLELRFYELQLGSDMLYLKEWLDHDAEAYC